MMLGCSSSLEENQFSSLAGLTDALQTNPHQIKTCMVTEYWHLRQWEKKDGAACPGFPKMTAMTHFVFTFALLDFGEIYVT